VKLSVRKRMGWVHVRGGRILRVAKEHAVRASGRSTLEGGKAPAGDEQWVYTKEGDLAVEVIAVKTGKVLGHSYLSGPAIQLNGYTPFDDDWFGEEVKSTFVDIPHPRGAFGDEFIKKVVGVLMDVKYSEEYGVGAFHYECDPGEDPRDVGQGIMQMWGYHDDREPTAHLFGLVTPAKGKKNVVVMHFQPPRDAADFAATGFQTELVLGVVRGAPTKS
jgi:hypothetical protein